MFKKCSNITKAPELPATNLAPGCYKYMFDGCTRLSYVKALFIDEPSEETTYFGLSGVASSGTFVKSKNATWDDRDWIPKGWTVVTE